VTLKTGVMAIQNSALQEINYILKIFNKILRYKIVILDCNDISQYNTFYCF